VYLDDKTVLFWLFRPFGVSGSQLKDLSDVIAGKTGGQLYTSAYRIIRDRNKIIVMQNEPVKEVSFSINDAEELKSVPGIRSVKRVIVTDDFVIPAGKNTACLDEAEITYPMVLRRWKKGDFFYPLGMSHKKKVSDYLIDKKISLPEKEKIMVLESKGRIVWVAGERIDDRFSITTSTTRALIIKYSVA
jgi:tRNA(Ile)-lysidine synthase